LALVVCAALATRVSANEEELGEFDESLELGGHHEGGLEGGLAGGHKEAGKLGKEGAFGLGGLFKKGGAPLSLQNLDGKPGSARVGGAGAVAPSAVSKVVEVEEGKKEHHELKKLGDWAKLILNPFELVKVICAHFKIPVDKTVEKIGKGLVFGAEALLHPIVASFKIVEKVFVPDVCRLKFICRIGADHFAFMRETMLKFSPSLLDGSTKIKAFSDGIIGRDCEVSFPNCDPTLKSPFAFLKNAETGAAAAETKSLARSLGGNVGLASAAKSGQPAQVGGAEGSGKASGGSNAVATAAAAAANSRPASQ